MNSRQQPLHPIDVVSPEIVRAAIARAVLGKTVVPKLGTLTLMPHQQDAVARLITVLRELHVALLADDVGLGKTYVALGVARRYKQVLVLAPAALLPMWRTALARAQFTGVQLQSIQSYSRQHDYPHITNSPAPASLVIVDEAHHLRTPSTKRYHAIANLVAGRDLLLLSATPIHNSPRDLRAILGLTLGTRANILSGALISRVIVRRTLDSAVPRVYEHPPLQVPHDPAVLSAILALPPPLPAHDGAVAGALIRIGLLRAWCSSDAALTRALRQRLLRGEALRQALHAGRHPTATELRSWLVGDHEVQLAFPELLAQHAPPTGPLLDVLDAHLSAVQSVLQRHRQGIIGDPARAAFLSELLVTHQGTPIVAFSQFSETVRAIGRALADIAGVGVLTGKRAWIASGTITRAEALARFAPHAQGRPPPPPHQRIRLLLTTDLLAEGVNLQDAGVVVHLDLPWTDALRAQRVGRSVRVGSPHARVHVYAIDPPMGANAFLRLTARIQRKAKMASHYVGANHVMPTHDSTESRNPSAADIASAFRDTMQSWAVVDAEPPKCSFPMVAAIHAPYRAFLALIHSAHGHRYVLGGRVQRTKHATGVRPRWMVSRAVRHLAPLAHAASTNQCAVTLESREWLRVNRLISRYVRRQSLLLDLGLSNGTYGSDALASLSPSHQRIHRGMASGIAKLPLASRMALRPSVQAVRDLLNLAQGAAAEQALNEWWRLRADMTFAQWLTAWHSFAPILAFENAQTELSGQTSLDARSKATDCTQCESRRESCGESRTESRNESRRITIIAALVLVPTNPTSDATML